MRRLILKNPFSPGDIVMMTAAVRDLHRCHPGEFLTDVRTSCPELWLNNPYLTPLREGDPGVETISCEYPLINRCDRTPYHCLHALTEFLNERLGLRIRPTEYKGDIHLSRREKAWVSQVHELTGEDTPFWIIVAGGKFDLTIKWWETRRYQEVVDHFRGRIQFVQVGQAGHYHPRLDGVIDLRGRTNLRQLVRLIYHAQGVVCPVTAVMHLAAAVEVKPGHTGHRPCVVIAGGREPAHWEAYPGHQFLHTIGALPCCATEGCWRQRTVAIGDGDERDHPDRLCVDVVNGLPRCMDMITAREVIHRIEMYFAGGVAKYLTDTQARAAARAVRVTAGNPLDQAPLTVQTARRAMEEFIQSLPEYPGGHEGRGIVICGGGVRHFTTAWVLINMLRRLGCRLPIQLWHLNEAELSEPMRALVTPLGVECVNAARVRLRHPARIRGGWPLKAYVLVHCPFREVLLLDADNVPVVNPEFLFETREFRETGAIFWPDAPWGRSKPAIWKLCGVSLPTDAPTFESGQIVIDKARCWKALRLALWFNEQSDFFYQFMHGDKDTFNLAFRRMGQPFAMPPAPMRPLEGTMLQHDFEGRPVFQHRNTDKWDLFPTNKRVEGFVHEVECLGYLEQLRRVWDGRINEVDGWRSKDWLTASSRVALSPGSPRIVAVMVTCSERDEVRRQTLNNLRMTDWGDAPVWVQMDASRSHQRVERIVQNAHAALTRVARMEADYVLYLEDDLEFNRFIRHNLEAWMPVRHGEVTLASLFNPGVTALACDVGRHFMVADPQSMYGSQAYLISLPMVRHLLRHWYDVAAPLDIKIPEIARRLLRPVLYHAPSLVQHTGRRSTWGGGWVEATDFDANWRAADMKESCARVTHATGLGAKDA